MLFSNFKDMSLKKFVSYKFLRKKFKSSWFTSSFSFALENNIIDFSEILSLPLTFISLIISADDLVKVNNKINIIYTLLRKFMHK